MTALHWAIWAQVRRAFIILSPVESVPADIMTLENIDARV